MNIIIPINVTAAMIKPGTSIAEPDATIGEVAWATGTFVIDDERISEHGTYVCVQAHTGRSTLPSADPAYWKFKQPSNRWMPFDIYKTTAAKGVGSMTYVMQPGFFNSLSLYGLKGLEIDVTVRDAPSGVVTLDYSADLFEQAPGLYELLFTDLLPREKLVIRGIPISPTAELTITVSAGVSDPVEIGMLNIGDYRPVIGAAEWGGTEYGAGAEMKDFSYIKFNNDGTAEVRQGGNSNDLHGTVVMPAASADYAVATIRRVLGKPVSCIATDVIGYDYLNTFGLISGSTTADNCGTARFNFAVKGFI